MKRIFFLLFILTLTCSCHNGKKSAPGNSAPFDSSKWQTKDDNGYLYRNGMLDSLLASDTLKKLKREGVTRLLGAPTRTDSNYVFYRVAQKLFAGFFPLHTKTLVIRFRADSSVEWTRIHQ